MLKVYHANQLDTLRDVLVEMIHRDPLEDPFTQEQILVQSPGMAQWLKLELAARSGIAANIEFPLPASFLWRAFVAALEDVPERSAYQKSSMTWVLMGLLPRHLTDPRFNVLLNYLDLQTDALSLYLLCGRIADLFDQYLVYRPDWIAAWERGEDTPVTDEEHLWQPTLWRAIVADTQARGLPHWHRANMYETFITALRKQSGELAGIPRRLFVFGISALPENYLQALVALGEKTEVHLMVANPCRHYWGDIVDPAYIARLNRMWLSKGESPEDYLHDSGHPLLASMGKLGRDYLHLIQEMSLPEVGVFSDANYESLLAAFQSDILELETRGGCDQAPPLMIQEPEQSIAVHSAYSPLREVEILHDQLLAYFERDPALKPRDIIVMMPDVAGYAPYIDAVFGNAQSERYLPYAISDRSADQEIPLLKSFLQLMTLDKSRFTVSQCLSLLELPATLRRFGLAQEDLDNIRRWVKDSGIHWGLNRQHRAEAGSVPFDENSWQSGLDRLFSGYAMGAVEDTWHQVAPYPGLTGLSSAALGELTAFVRTAESLSAALKGEKTLTAWLALIQQVIQDFYEPDEQDHEAIELIYQTLETVKTTHQEVGFEQPFDVAILQDFLKESLTTQRASQRFLSGQINFCTLMPMRSIPFKVVCLLGMNDGAYPRSLPPVGFDLMAKFPRKGDRSRRDDDRYLFLEALLSARQTLYISYVGRSIADNSPRIPSVLVSEVLEYIDQAYRLAGVEQPLSDYLTTEHPLTPYSTRYFSEEDDPLFSYNPLWDFSDTHSGQEPTATFVTGALPDQSSDVKTLELASLMSFYRHPIQYFFQKRMQVWFRDEETPLEDEEPFAIDPLDDYALRKGLLSTVVQGRSLKAYSDYLRASGNLPVGKAGDLILKRRIHDIETLYEKLQPLMEGEAQREEIRVQLGEHLLEGWVGQRYAGGFLRYDVAKVSGRHRFTTWVQHLACCAAGYQERTLYRGLSEAFAFRAIPATEARQQLLALVDTYWRGMSYPLNWLADPAWLWLEKSVSDPEKALANAQKRFEDERGGDQHNLYVARVYPEWHLIEPGLLDLTQRLFVPMLDYLEEIHDSKSA